MPLAIQTYSSATSFAVLACTALLSGCLVDPDRPCGDDQTPDAGSCQCEDGYGLVDNRCVACGEHEVGSAEGCGCEDGYVRPVADGACEKAEHLGAPCTSDAECVDPKYAHCQLDGDAGYCTRADCESSEDCEVTLDWACNTHAAPSFCERPPSGIGKSCTSSDECEGFEASYCEALSAHACLVNECKDAPEICHGDWVCCDLAIISTSLCIPPGELVDGACPVGGTLIERAP
jgi:hypothetical protein